MSNDGDESPIDIEVYEARCAEAEEKVKRAEAEIRLLKKRSLQLYNEGESLRKELASMKNERDEALAEREEALDANKALSDDNDRLNATLSAATNQISRLQNELATHTQDQDKIKQLEVRAAVAERLVKENADLRALVKLYQERISKEEERKRAQTESSMLSNLMAEPEVKPQTISKEELERLQQQVDFLQSRRELAKSEFLTLLNQYTAEKKANASRLLDLQLDLTQATSRVAFLEKLIGVASHHSRPPTKGYPSSVSMNDRFLALINSIGIESYPSLPLPLATSPPSIPGLSCPTSSTHQSEHGLPPPPSNSISSTSPPPPNTPGSRHPFASTSASSPSSISRASVASTDDLASSIASAAASLSVPSLAPVDVLEVSNGHLRALPHPSPTLSTSSSSHGITSSSPGGQTYSNHSLTYTPFELSRAARIDLTSHSPLSRDFSLPSSQPTSAMSPPSVPILQPPSNDPSASRRFASSSSSPRPHSSPQSAPSTSASNVSNILPTAVELGFIPFSVATLPPLCSSIQPSGNPPYMRQQSKASLTTLPSHSSNDLSLRRRLGDILYGEIVQLDDDDMASVLHPPLLHPNPSQKRLSDIDVQLAVSLPPSISELLTLRKPEDVLKTAGVPITQSSLSANSSSLHPTFTEAATQSANTARVSKLTLPTTIEGAVTECLNASKRRLLAILLIILRILDGSCGTVEALLSCPASSSATPITTSSSSLPLNQTLLGAMLKRLAHHVTNALDMLELASARVDTWVWHRSRFYTYINMAAMAIRGDPQFEEIIKEEHARLASSSPLSWQGLVTAASSLTSFLGTSTSNSSSSSSSSSQSSSENQGSLSQVEEVSCASAWKALARATHSCFLEAIGRPRPIYVTSASSSPSFSPPQSSHHHHRTMNYYPSSMPVSTSSLAASSSESLGRGLVLGTGRLAGALQRQVNVSSESSSRIEPNQPQSTQQESSLERKHEMKTKVMESTEIAQIKNGGEDDEDDYGEVEVGTAHGSPVRFSVGKRKEGFAPLTTTDEPTR